MKQQTATIADILKLKGSAVDTIRPKETVETLSRRLRQRQIGAMAVSDDGETLFGIVSERDVAYGVAVHRGELHKLSVSDLMTSKVITCSPEDTLATAAKMMSALRIRHLPVTDGNKLVGVIAMRDIMMHRLEAIQRTSRLVGNLVVSEQ